MRKVILNFLLICLLGVFFNLYGQGGNLRSPHQTTQFFLKNLQHDNYQPQQAAKAFLWATEGDQQKAVEYAIKWKQVLDGSGHYIDLESIPKNWNYLDSSEMSHKFIISDDFPNIALIRVNQQWVFSKASLPAILEAHQELFRFGTDRLLNLLPKLGTREILGLYLYQYLGILILILMAILIHRILSFFINKILVRLVRRSGIKELQSGYLIPIARPFSWFLVTFFVLIFVPALQLPPESSRYVIMLLRSLLPLFATIVLYRFTNVLSEYLMRLAEKTESTLDDQLVPLLRKTLKTFVIVIGTLFILANLNIDIIPLLTGLSIGGLAFALAAQDTIKNFFGSLMIFIDKPFQIGDWITSGDIDGSVEEVGLRSSRIRTFRNSLMYVPNSKLADSTIDNHGLRKYRRFYTQIAVTYDTPPDLIQTFVEGLRKVVETHPDTRKDFYNVYFNDMAAYSLNIMFYIFFEVPNWQEEIRA
jgi:MscS family membrane protein